MAAPVPRGHDSWIMQLFVSLPVSSAHTDQWFTHIVYIRSFLFLWRQDKVVGLSKQKIKKKKGRKEAKGFLLLSFWGVVPFFSVVVFVAFSSFLSQPLGIRIVSYLLLFFYPSLDSCLAFLLLLALWWHLFCSVCRFLCFFFVFVFLPIVVWALYTGLVYSSSSYIINEAKEEVCVVRAKKVVHKSVIRFPRFLGLLCLCSHSAHCCWIVEPGFPILCVGVQLFFLFLFFLRGWWMQKKKKSQK